MIASEIRRLLQCVTCGKDPKTCKCTEVDEDQKGMCKKWEGGKLATYIEEAPTVDAVPVIRCKDCKWYKRDHNGGCLCETGGGLYNSQPEDYCSRAERRKDDRRQNNTV